ncbi:protein of unknown function [Trichlorobacter ammonificans]|uniref:Restriction endonuclease type IV Mrr domain-containing protein n=1 Tax=Trichlorobacter ammonificans TaxID=2916410 RepID=A0ABN8HHC8_9BACT|nr:protein of unknown function [Trichlorobacter ammonificans]
MTYIAENALNKYSSIGNADYDGIMASIENSIESLSAPNIKEIALNFAGAIDISDFLLLNKISIIIINFVHRETYNHLTYIDYKVYFDEIGEQKSNYQDTNSHYDEFNDILSKIRQDIVTKYFKLNYRKSLRKIVNTEDHNSLKKLEYQYSSLKNVLSKYNLYKDNFYNNIALFSIVNKAVNKYCADMFINSTGISIDNLLNRDLEFYINLLFSNIITNNEDVNIALVAKFILHYSNNNNETYTDLFNTVSSKYYNSKLKYDNDNFEQKLINKQITTKNEITIEDADLMSGEEFEALVGKLFTQIGYAVSYTKKSGDQGIDIIAQKQGIRIGVQAKRYSGTVSNSAIQEVVAGKAHYNCTKAIVVTNSIFTQPAIELANSNGVILWDRNILKQKISESSIKCDSEIILNECEISSTPKVNNDLFISDNIFCRTQNLHNVFENETRYYKKISTHAPINKYYNDNNPVKDKATGNTLFNLSQINVDESDAELIFTINQLTDYIIKYNNFDDFTNFTYEKLSERDLEDDWNEITIKAYVNAVNIYLNRGSINQQEEHSLCEYVENMTMIEEFEEYLIATEKLYRMINKDSNFNDKNRFIRMCDECGYVLPLGDDSFTTLPDKSIICLKCYKHK